MSDDVIDLGIGEPFFLQDTLLDVLESKIQPSSHCARHYPDKHGLPVLKTHLRNLQPQYRFIIPTIGARQGKKKKKKTFFLS